MSRCWLIPILLLVALETRVFAETVGNAHSVAVARVDQDGAQLNATLQRGFFKEDLVVNAVQVAQASSDSLLNWYGSDAVYSVRLVLAGALGFLLVLLALHVLLPSSAGRSSDETQGPTCSSASCSCHHGQQVPNGNAAAVKDSIAGAGVGNFLPLGISLNHLNALGQQTNGKIEDNTGQFEELTLKVKALEERLRQVSDNSSAGMVDQDVACSADLPGVEKPLDPHSSVVASTAPLEASKASSDPEQEVRRAPADSKSQGKRLPDPLFDGLVSETLAVIYSQ